MKATLIATVIGLVGWRVADRWYNRIVAKAEARQ